MDLRTWDRRHEKPLVVAAIAFAVFYAYQVLAEPSGWMRTATEVAMTVVWVVFVIDYVARLWLAPRKGPWFVRHLPDLAMVAIPALRPLRIFGLMIALQRLAGAKLRGKVMLYVSGATIVLVLLSAVAMLDAERYADDASIVTFGDAVWWAMVTVTTVGYGDTYPVTTTGRLIAASMMVAGIALLGTVTATLASWLVQRISDQDETNQAATQKQVNDLAAEIRALRAVVDQSARPASASEPGPKA